jgi:hypothetical protein
MARLDPAIHRASQKLFALMDAWAFAAPKGRRRVKPGHDERKQRSRRKCG